MLLSKAFLCLATTATQIQAVAIGNPFDARGLLPNHIISGLPETLPNDNNGLLYKTYQPYLAIKDGCVPYPAVDAQGNTNTGLSHHGTESSGCTNSLGQSYVRGAPLNDGTDRYALMYAWYMPKDVPSRGMGHRHEWEGSLVILSSANSTSASNILSVCPSAHGKWNCDNRFKTEGGTAPLLEYKKKWPMNHSMWLGGRKGEKQTLVGWEALPEKTRKALQETNFRAGTVPFKDGTFEKNIASVLSPQL